jgi:G3E family GTPase
MTKVDIFSGFLGAGKTTLIKKLIQEAYTGERLVLIENEFGEIGIDGGFMEDAGIEVTEMNSGCICCSLVGDFGQALQKVLEQYHPDRILIEPSGVGKLSDVIQAVESLHSQKLKLNAFVTVADASKCRLYMKNFGEFYNNQIAHAGAIVLSRTEHMPEAKILECLDLLRQQNAHATIMTTPWTELSGAQILEVMEQKNTLEEELKDMEKHQGGHTHHHDHHHEHDCGCNSNHHHHHEHEHEYEHDHEHTCSCGCGHHHDADEVFTSWGLETPKKFTEEELKAMLENLPEESAYGLVLRAKGIVPAKDGSWLHFDYVPGEGNLRKGCPGVIGRLCVIGAELNEDALKKLFCVS